MAAPDANGNKRTVVNPEAVQCSHREIGTDKSACVYRWKEVAIAIAASA
jgi:hypothetical protein